MKSFRFVILITLGLFLFGQNSWAAKAYVTDSFRISLRRGPSIENKILKFLPSGQPVEILESEEGWSHVQLIGHDQANLKGWVLSRYLINRLPWEKQVENLKQENSRLKETLVRIEKEWGESENLQKNLAKDLKEKIKSLDRTKEEYETLKHGASDYLKMKSEYENALQKLNKLTKENKSLKSSDNKKWFAIGAVVLLFGLMIGIVMGRQQRRNKSSYY